MPISENLLAHFTPEGYFHIICKCIDGKTLFKTDENRSYFLKRYHDFLFDFADTYAYCLLDNHVHWFVKIKPEQELIQMLKKQLHLTITHKKFLENKCSFHELIEQQFNRFFISYSLAYNISLSIKGHLFSRPFKRIELSDDAHITQLIIYMHANAQKHGICKDFSTYRWSSYSSILSDRYSSLKRAEVLEWFGGRERFIDIHQQQASNFRHLFSGE